ncbi:MAG: hypothetical protein CBC90_06240 [Acidimicrobiaceae bacterium TMED130]|nr:MAG: hypothetical protein CBC90_06240 [Acidimicrobiaceae bacterium TMED130]|tara:strand:- start:12514 stop:13683 length:1170 start_codon:yes stop_codon:yes gene_type:complete
MPIPKSIYVAIFTLTASIGVVFGLIASLQDDLGFADGILGLIAAAAFFSAVVAQLLLAPLADRGHTKILMAGAIIIAALGSLWFAVASSAWELILARLLTGLGIGAFAPAARAVVANTDPSRAGERLGRLTAVETSGFVAGPVVGAFINEIWGLKAPFLTFCCALVLILPGLLRVKFSSPPVKSKVSRTDSVFVILRRKEALGSILLGAALFFPAGMYEAIWARFMEDLGASTLFVGVSLTMYGVPFAITASMAGKFIDRSGPWLAAVFAVVIIIPMTVIYGFLASPILLMALAMFEALGQGIGSPACHAAMVAATDENERATGQGLVAAASSIGAGIAALLAAPLYAGPGPEVTFIIVAGVVLVLSLIAFRLNGFAFLGPVRGLVSHD